MRVFSYKNKLRLKRLALVLLAIVLIAALFVVGYYVYLQRYVVYTSDGAYLDLPGEESATDEAKVSQFVSGELMMDTQASREYPPSEEEVVAETVGQVETPLQGYWVDPSTLSDASVLLDAVDEDLSASTEDDEAATTEITVLITVKSTAGLFYYDSSLGESADCADLTEELLDELSQREVRLVALLPAFADSAFALENQDEGLPISGGALWMDENSSYWVDPTWETAQEYVVSICKELKRLGFTGVVFSDFAFPESVNIVYDSEYTRSELTVQTAEAVTEALSSTGLALSFLADGTESAFAATTLASRVYLQLDDGSAVADTAALYEGLLSDTSLQLVFLTESRDTRFEDYGVLRPIS